MTDKELLEMAAKAAGVAGIYHKYEDSRGAVSSGIAPKGASGRDWWNPLGDDGDALRLAVKLGISLEVDASIEVGSFTFRGVTDGEYEIGVEAWKVMQKPEVHVIAAQEVFGDNKAAATRRAITRAAAEIGRKSVSP